MKLISPRRAGFGLIEVVIGAAIMTGFVAAAISALAGAARLEADLVNKTEAQYLTEEGLETVRLIRDGSWKNNIAPLTINSPYYLTFTGGIWHLTATPALLDNLFSRQIIFHTGYRDGSHNIAASGTVDPDLRQVTVTVSWPSRGGMATASLTAYLTNLFGN